VSFERSAPRLAEPKTRRTDAFPRNGAVGPGCQAATVADGRSRSHPNEVKDECADRSGAVAEECVLMQRRPDERQTKARHREGGGLEVRPRDARGARGARTGGRRGAFTTGKQGYPKPYRLKKFCRHG